MGRSVGFAQKLESFYSTRYAVPVELKKKTVYVGCVRNEYTNREASPVIGGFSLLNFDRGLKKTMGYLILKLYVVIILY